MVKRIAGDTEVSSDFELLIINKINEIIEEIEALSVAISELERKK